MRVLAVADKVAELIHGPNIRRYFGGVELVLSCGDLPYDYLEYIVTLLNVPVLFVRGNHDREWEQAETGVVPAAPGGCVNLDCRLVHCAGLAVAGLDGSLRYKVGPYQYSDGEMRWRIRRLWPWLWLNRLRTGRYLDVLVTHAPPRGINDREDVCHQGFPSLRRFLDRFRPRYHIHGHVHLYGRDQHWRASYGQTEVLNVFGYRVLEVDVPLTRGAQAGRRG